jgi:hypothetical protein
VGLGQAAEAVNAWPGTTGPAPETCRNRPAARTAARS